MNKFTKIPYSTLKSVVSNTLYKSGIPKNQAVLEAEIMTEADLCGTPSHGIRMLPGLIKSLEDKTTIAKAEIKTTREMGAISVLDCNNGPGRYTALTATGEAIKRAKQFGVGVTLAKNTTHWGRAHAYAYRGAQQNCILMCTTNAISTMAIAGAKTRVIGNNPLAIGVPGVEADKPLVLDMAMSQAAVGKVNTWLREEKPLPDNWGLDKEGNPTNDAQAILDGAVTPMGKHKGAGLAVMFEAMTAALAGAALTQHITTSHPGGPETHTTKLFIALNIEAFIDMSQYTQKVSELLHHLKTQANPFYFPGERGWTTRDEHLNTGVKIHKDTLKALANAGVNF